MTNTYRSIQGISEGVYKEKGSKFLAFIYPCDNAVAAKNLIDLLWKKNPGAVHVCYAWRFGKRKFEDRISDDGEPANSAGKPIFGQILAYDLTNILIAVVRYYGGTNLGVGGLIQAYKSASKDGLDKAAIIENNLCDYFTITFTFEITGEVMNILQKKNIKQISSDYSETGTTIKFSISQEMSKGLAKDFEHLPNINLIKTGTDQ